MVVAWVIRPTPCSLAQVLLQLGDWAACLPLLARILSRDGSHPRALQLQRFIAACESEPSQPGV